MILASLVLLAVIAFTAGAFTALLWVWWSDTAPLRDLRDRQRSCDRERGR